jgi:hypothetical protein
MKLPDGRTVRSSSASESSPTTQGLWLAAGLWFWFATVVPAQLEPGSLPGGKAAGPRLGPIVRLELTIPDRQGLEALTRAGYDVASVAGNTVFLYADQEEAQALQALGWPVKVLPPAAALGIPGAKGLGVYNGYASLTAMLDGYVAAYPALCRKLSIGRSVQGRDLWALKITTNPDSPQDKPKFKYISTIHGNEPVGTEMSLYLIDLLLKGYVSNDVRIVNLVNSVEIWFLPLVNPDGRESNPPMRYNANGYDLNRSFPEGSGTDFGNLLYGPAMNTNGLQVEVREMMAFSAAHNFSLGANFHSGALVVNYPYDNDGLGSVFSPSPDELLFQVISRAYSSNNAPMWNSPSFANGIVNGAAWYSVSGGLQDWSYRYGGILDVTIELANYQWPDPPASQLATYWSQNRESMLSYLEWCLRGVRGVLRDAQTGQPVRGTVRVEGFHHLVFSDAVAGDYHRLLLPGTYTVWCYAPGYVPQRLTNVTVGAGAATRLDVALQPVSPRFAAKVNFQPAAASIPAGFVVDAGAAFGVRAGGYTYGWDTALPAGNVVERRAARSQDLRYDTCAQMQAGGGHTWEIAVPNGPYSVLVAAGDPSYANGYYRIQAEEVVLIDAAPVAADRWLEGLGTVVVTDGRLTLSNAPGAVSNRLAFVEISAREPITIDQWRAVFFGTTNNIGLAADTADPDHDGLLNLLEYALNTNPNIADAGPALSAVVRHLIGADWLEVSFARNTNATDLVMSVQMSETLPAAQWSTLTACTNGNSWTGAAPVAETPSAPGQVRVTVRDPQPVTGTGNRFYRVTVAKKAEG